ncbi:hypothetical protein CEXT_209081 [Caerostris extrusa]|uniref:Uncharacterized protein n=1 Tax=Caerostris extrusa TaxID=172846 RepID=A0AAV4MGF4_CAEEX|nr:hypothetical protein CEXT_209081 [Caerostris extrusa]
MQRGSLEFGKGHQDDRWRKLRGFVEFGQGHQDLWNLEIPRTCGILSSPAPVDIGEGHQEHWKRSSSPVEFGEDHQHLWNLANVIRTYGIWRRSPVIGEFETAYLCCFIGCVICKYFIIGR